MSASSAGPVKVGIILLNWNGWADTIECLESVGRLDYPNYETYVIDNASSDGSEARLRSWNPALKVLQSGGNLGWAGGCNVGIRAAKADGCEHIYLLNNDAVVCPDTLTHLVEAASAAGAAALGSLVVSAADANWAEFAGTVMDERSHHPGQVSCRTEALPSHGRPTPTLAVKGCSMLMTGSAMATIGLLAEEYFLNYDELDWCFRARAAGLVNYYVPASVVAHKGARSFKGVRNPLYRYFITRNRLLFAERHLDAHGQWFAWRTAAWEVRQAIMLEQEAGRSTVRHRALLTVSVLLAIRDYCMRRFGDCPPLVRSLSHRYLAA